MDRGGLLYTIWFSAPGGEIMVCRTGQGFLKARTWVFDAHGQLTDDGILLVGGG